nr:hypothetical protein [uncultured bacterium]
MHPDKRSGYSVARLSRLVWDEEVASSNLATPTKTSLLGWFFYFKMLCKFYLRVET